MLCFKTKNLHQWVEVLCVFLFILQPFYPSGSCGHKGKGLRPP